MKFFYKRVLGTPVCIVRLDLYKNMSCAITTEFFRWLWLLQILTLMTAKYIECTSRYCNPADLMFWSVCCRYGLYLSAFISLLIEFGRVVFWGRDCISLPGTFPEIPFHICLASIWNPPLVGFICFPLVVGGWKAKSEHSLRLLMDWRSEDFHLAVSFSRQRAAFSPFICMTRYFSPKRYDHTR